MVPAAHVCLDSLLLSIYLTSYLTNHLLSLIYTRDYFRYWEYTSEKSKVVPAGICIMVKKVSVWGEGRVNW
jgi:hypothetical protein